MLEQEFTGKLQEIVEAASRSFGRPVAIDDRAMRLLAYTEHDPAEVDEVRLLSVMKRPLPAAVLAWADRHGIRHTTTPVIVPGNPALGLDSRVCAPIRCHGRLLGFLWLTDRDGSLTADDRSRAGAFAEQAGLILYDERMLRDDDRRHEQALLVELLGEDPLRREDALLELGERCPALAEGEIVVLVIPLAAGEGPQTAARQRAVGDVLARVRRRLTPRRSLHVVESDRALILIAPDDPAVRALGITPFARSLQTELRSAAPDERVIVGVGGPVGGLGAARASLRQALRAAALTAATTRFGDVACWPDLGVYRLLAELPEDARDPATLVPGLRTLLSGPRTASLVETLECYLDNAGDAGRTAAALHLHRTSLYHRLRRIEQLADVDLADGEDRLALHLGLRLARLAPSLATSDG